MKKIIFGLLILVFSIGAFAQSKLSNVGTYTLNGISHTCYISPEDKELYIGLEPTDSKIAQLKLPLYRQEVFIVFLEIIKSKYIEYDSIRIANNIQEVEFTQMKNFNFVSTYEFRFYRYSEFVYDFASSFNSNWYSIRNGILYFDISTYLTSSDNQYINDFVSLKFNSVEEIDALINILSDKTKIDNIINEVLNKQKLFN